METATKTRRVRLAGRDRLTIAQAPDESGASPSLTLTLDTPVERPHWHPRIAGKHHRPTHPGTPILFRDRFYEVLSRGSQEAQQTRYVLAPWDPDFGMRAPASLDDEAIHEDYARQAEAERLARARPVVLALSPFLGLLPADWQKELEDRYDHRSDQATGISGFVFMVVYTVSLVFLILRMLALGKVSFLIPLSSILLGESILRWASGWHLKQAMGSLPVVLACRLFDRLRPSRALAAIRRATAPDLTEDSVVDDRHGEERRLTIECEREKTDWLLHRTGLDYDGELWIPVHYERDEETDVHRYKLELHTEGDALIQRLRYDPREAHLRRSLLLLEKDRTLVQTISPFIGLLDADRKRALEAAHQIDPAAATRSSILMTGIFSIFAATMALAHLSSDQGDPLDLAPLVFGVLGIVDALRRKALAQRQPGSPLGLPFQGFADAVLARAQHVRRQAFRFWGEDGPVRTGQAPSPPPASSSPSASPSTPSSAASP